MGRHVAVVVFNLGGPTALQDVKPFLFNLFYDPHILRVPNPLRWIIAQMIAWRRAPVARHIYEQIGGGSPLLQQTKQQALALERSLNSQYETSGIKYKVFVAMSYWRPFIHEAVVQVKAFTPDQIVLLPLYPQYSSATTLSCFDHWQQFAVEQNLTCPTAKICCYPEQPGFIQAYQQLIRNAYYDVVTEFDSDPPPRILFSAHSLPLKLIKQGDPYQQQVEQSIAAIMAGLTDLQFDSVVTCYQSKVGPVKWLGPQTDDEIIRAGQDQRGVIVVPVAFVSEHSETLVELDLEYSKLAFAHQLPYYVRVPTVTIHPDFIEGLASQVRIAAKPLAAATGSNVTSEFVTPRRCGCESKLCLNPNFQTEDNNDVTFLDARTARNR